MTRGKRIEETVTKILSILESEELKNLQKDSQKLHELEELLKNVKFKIKKITVTENQETNLPRVIITYELPTVILDIDEHGEPNKDDFFYSSNMLNMIDLDDMQAVNKTLQNIKK